MLTASPFDGLSHLPFVSCLSSQSEANLVPRRIYFMSITQEHSLHLLCHPDPYANSAKVTLTTYRWENWGSNRSSPLRPLNPPLRALSGVGSRIPPFIYSFLPLGLYLTHSNCTNPLGAIWYQCRHSTCKEHDVIDQGDWHAFHALLHVATRLCWIQTLLSIWRQSLGLKAQAGLELKIFLPRPLECWRPRHTPVTLSFNPVLANHSFPWIIYLSLKLREDDSGFADWCAFRPMCSFSKLDATLP